MPSAKYYREQAQLLLSWALVASDPDYAALLTTRAIKLLARSNEADGSRLPDLNAAIAEFNDYQMRGRPKLQQQQIQPQSNED